jgi:hypothetical protein
MYIFYCFASFHLRCLTAFTSGLAVNFLLIESLQRFHQYYGDDLQVSYFVLVSFLRAKPSL